MYKIHRENHVQLSGSHIVPETDPLAVVDTLEQAKEMMFSLIRNGVRPGDRYAVGFDSPTAEIS